MIYVEGEREKRRGGGGQAFSDWQVGGGGKRFYKKSLRGSAV